MNKTIRIVQGSFAGIFFLTIISAYIRGLKSGVPILGAVFITILSIVGIAALTLLYSKLKSKKISSKKADRIFLSIAVSMLILQIIFAVALKSTPRSDWGYIDRAARDFCLTWDKHDLYHTLPERHQDYFARYTNNQALLIILSCLYSVCYAVFGEMPIMAPIILNTLGLNISVILMYFIAKRIFKNNTAPLFCGIFASGFSVFYTYTPFFYTDSISMPFSMGSILLFLRGMDSSGKPNKIFQFIMSGAIMAAGYKIKGSVIILLPAFILFLVAFTKRET